MKICFRAGSTRRNLHRCLRTIHQSVQPEESLPSLLQLPSTGPGKVSCSTLQHPPSFKKLLKNQTKTCTFIPKQMTPDKRVDEQLADMTFSYLLVKDKRFQSFVQGLSSMYSSKQQ